jgi:hypothetical protein
VPAAAGGTQAAATAPTSRSCSPPATVAAPQRSRSASLPARPAIGLAADGGQAGRQQTPDTCPSGPRTLSEWTPYLSERRRARPGGHRALSGWTPRTVRVDPADAVRTPGPDTAARLAKPRGQQGSGAAAGGPRGAADHRRRPASLPGCDAATVRASMTRTRADGACPRRTPGLAGRTRWTWTAGRCAPSGGRGRGRCAGAEPVVGDGDHDQGDEGHELVAGSSRQTAEQDAGAGAVACRRLAPSCPWW